MDSNIAYWVSQHKSDIFTALVHDKHDPIINREIIFKNFCSCQYTDHSGVSRAETLLNTAVSQGDIPYHSATYFNTEPQSLIVIFQMENPTELVHNVPVCCLFLRTRPAPWYGQYTRAAPTCLESTVVLYPGPYQIQLNETVTPEMMSYGN